MSNARAIRRFFETASLGAPENAIGFVLWRVVHRYQRDVDRVLEPLELTHLQFTTLMIVAWLGRNGRPVAQGQVASDSDIHPMQVSQMLKVLESKGLVERTRSPTDIRAKLVELTTAGLAALRAALPAVIDLQRRVFGAEGGVDGALLAALRRVEEAQRNE
jgi:DNA-binding MarR family transcriptional regulator